MCNWLSTVTADSKMSLIYRFLFSHVHHDVSVGLLDTLSKISKIFLTRTLSPKILKKFSILLGIFSEFLKL